MSMRLYDYTCSHRYVRILIDSTLNNSHYLAPATASQILFFSLLLLLWLLELYRS